MSQRATASVLLGALCLVLCSATQSAEAQSCCGKLDVPLAGTERAANRHGQLIVGLAYELGFSAHGYVQDGYGIARAQTHTATLDASYGVTSWFTPSLALPLAWKQYDPFYVGGVSESRHVFGPGDALVLAKLAFVGQRSYAPGELRIWAAPGIKLPTGAYQDGDAFGRLPPPAQLGSGSFDAVGAVFASVGLRGEASKTLLLLSAVGRLTTENSEHYRFGSSVETTAYLNFSRVLPHLALRIGPSLRVGARDTQSGFALHNTGGLRTFASAGAVYSFEENLSVTLDAQVPVYSHVNERQLEPVWSASLGVIVAYP